MDGLAMTRRILVINPNNNPAVSEGIRLAAARVVCAGTEVTVVNPPEGPLSIESLEDRAQAIPHLLALVDDYRGQGFDACVLGCYDDIALDEIRRRLKIPVLGAFEASIAAARSVSARFCIVTTVHSALPTIEALLQTYGAQSMATVLAAGIGVADAAAGTEAAQHKLRHTIVAAIEQHGADAIVLGSGGLTGRASALAKAFKLPVVDAVLTAITQAEGLAKLLKHS